MNSIPNEFLSDQFFAIFIQEVNRTLTPNQKCFINMEFCKFQGSTHPALKDIQKQYFDMLIAPDFKNQAKQNQYQTFLRLPSTKALKRKVFPVKKKQVFLKTEGPEKIKKQSSQVRKRATFKLPPEVKGSNSKSAYLSTWGQDQL